MSQPAFSKALLERHLRWIQGGKKDPVLKLPGDRLDVRDEKLVGGSLPSARFEGCQFTDVHFVDTRFHSVQFVDCTLSRVRFERCELNGAFLTNCVLDDVSMVGGEAANARFTQVRASNLQTMGWNLVKADLVDCDLSAANLTGALLKKCFALRLCLAGSDLTDADLSFATFDDCDLRAVNLDRAIVERARLTGCGIGGLRGHPRDPERVFVHACDGSPERDGTVPVDQAKWDGSWMA